MCVMWNSAVKGQILKNQAVTEVLNLEHYIHPWKTLYGENYDKAQQLILFSEEATNHKTIFQALRCYLSDVMIWVWFYPIVFFCTPSFWSIKSRVKKFGIIPVVTIVTEE